MFRETNFASRLPSTCSCGEDLSTLEAEDYLRYGCSHVIDGRKLRKVRGPRKPKNQVQEKPRPASKR